MPNLTGDQLELFADSPFALRLPFPEALRLFWEFYWKHLPSAKSTRTHFKRLGSFFGGFYLDTLTKSDVEGFRRSYRILGLSESTTNKAHMILTRIYNKMHEYREAGKVNGVDFSKIVLPPKDKNPGKLVKKVNEKQFQPSKAVRRCPASCGNAVCDPARPSAFCGHAPTRQRD